MRHSSTAASTAVSFSEFLKNPSSSQVEVESHFHQRLLDDGNPLISSSSASTNSHEYRRTDLVVNRGTDEQRRISATVTPSPAIAQFQPSSSSSSSATERAPRMEEGSRPITPVPNMPEKDDYFNGRIGEDEEEVKRIKKRWRMEI